MDQVSILDPQLKSATRLEITGQLHQLFSSLPQKAGDDPVAVLNGYLIALEGLPLWAIETTVHSYLRGMIKGHDRKFCPRAPELATAVRDERDRIMHHSAQSKIKSGKCFSYVKPRSKIIARGVTREQMTEGRQSGEYPPGSIWLPGFDDTKHIGEVVGPDPNWKLPESLTDGQ